MNAAAEDLAHAAGVLHVVKVLVRDEKVRDDDIGLLEYIQSAKPDGASTAT